MNRPLLRSAASQEKPTLGGRTSRLCGAPQRREGATAATSARDFRARVEPRPPGPSHFRGDTRWHFKKAINPETVVITLLCYLVGIHGGTTAWGAEEPARFVSVVGWRGS